ncbi:hypothetical protein PIB30_092702 [Stylosanthes scabra]|uniref:Uncharacterized protein n=1 Tax=Stylosanthes scabra TaxID=79078 RepID=A0ABU6TX44_9FABA|nr:hypothetical protein [Stylosanthes scabra]
MEMQGIPVTMANLAIHRQREEANKGKAKEIVPDSEDSEDTFFSREAWVSNPRSTLTLDNLDQLVRDYRLNTHSKELPCNRAFKVKKNPKGSKKKLIGEDRIEVKKRLHNDP